MVEILPEIKNRRSSYSFTKAPVSAEMIDTMVEAFRWAPSSANKQPWRLIIVQGEEAHKRHDACLSENNVKWATEAPVKMVIIGSPEEQPDRHGQQRWLLDLGLAIENLLIQGSAMGLAVHAMVGWDEPKLLEAFHVPDTFRVAALFAVGHPGKIEDLSPEMQEKASRPPSRRPVEEIVFWDDFGKSQKS